MRVKKQANEATGQVGQVLQRLGECLSSPEEAPWGWRGVGEALLGMPGVSAVLFLVWREGIPPATLSMGDTAGAQFQELERSASSTPMGDGQAAGGSAVALPIGGGDQPEGIAAVVVAEPAPLVRASLEVAASGFATDLRRRRMAREVEQARAALQEQITGAGEQPAVSQLAASVAHELRNPLSSIKGAAQYLRNEYHDHATVREFLDIIIEEVGVLNRITTEFLDFARPMHPNLEQTHVHDSIRKLLQIMKAQMAAQGVEVATDLGPEVPPTVFDSRQVEQMLRNIVMNAVQAMPDGGTLKVRTRLVDTPLPGVEIAISDTGRGITPEDVHRLFTPFFTTKTKGVGLGLTIVQRIVQNHGGTISVASEPGQGSTFSVRLPYAPGAEGMRVSR